MWRFMALSQVVLVLCLSCASLASRTETWPWPDDTSFVVMDEILDITLPDRVDGGALRARNAQPEEIHPTVNRLLLLPVVENYLWNGKRHALALADPIVVKPDERPIRQVLLPLLKHGQYVRRCILIAHGYCPGDLDRSWNCTREYEGKKVWLNEMTKLSKEQFKAASRIIVNELSSSTLRVFNRQVQFEDAIKQGRLLSVCWLWSPLIGEVGYSKQAYVFWTARDGAEVSICLSPEGLHCVKEELLGPQEGQGKKEQTETAPKGRNGVSPARRRGLSIARFVACARRR